MTGPAARVPADTPAPDWESFPNLPPAGRDFLEDLLGLQLLAPDALRQYLHDSTGRLEQLTGRPFGRESEGRPDAAWHLLRNRVEFVHCTIGIAVASRATQGDE